MSLVQTKDTKDVVSTNHGYAVRDRMLSFSAAETPKAAAKPGMYGWLFPDLPALNAKPAGLDALGEAMIEHDGPQSKAGDSQVPAGFAFLGQFVDHDLTFDTTPLPERVEDPTATTNFRTPALDLDCLYGNGPRVHPFLYQRDGKSFLIGRNETVTGFPEIDNDLPRNADGMALLADPRNDENLIVAQLHLAMLKFHNNVVATSGDLDFEQVRQLVTLHYQWIVLNDFLPKIVDTAVLNDVLAGGPQFYKPAEFAFIPVEFGAAAYRFGHSLIRETYDYNASFPDAHLSSLLALTGPGGELDFTLPVPANWVIDWNRFFFNELDPPPQCNCSRKINTVLSQSLGTLLFTPKGETPNLAIRNLRRGNAFRLPSGQSVAAAIEKKTGVSAEVLEPAEIKAAGDDGSVAAENGFLDQTPLWYYILKEAELRADGRHLGPVGSRILSEVFVGLLKRPGGLLHEKTIFRPSLGKRDGQFTILDLLERAAEPLSAE